MCRLRECETWSILSFSVIQYSFWVPIPLHGKICHFKHFQIKSLLNLRLLIIKMKKYLQMLWNTLSLSQLWYLCLSSIPGAIVSSVGPLKASVSNFSLTLSAEECCYLLSLWLEKLDNQAVFPPYCLCMLGIGL